MIQIKELIKTYKGLDRHVLDISTLNVAKGEIFGLLGPNGAGKTTLINILCGLSGYDSGTVHVWDWDIRNYPSELRSMIGIVPQDIALYPTLTALENLQFFGMHYGISAKQCRQYALEGLQTLGLEKYKDRRIQTFSGGMNRRVNLLAAVLHQPELLILDEPTVGIDVQSRHMIIDFLHQKNSEGCTIFYTSHHLKEAETFCQQICIIDEGKVIVEGSPQQLKTDYQKTHLEEVFLHLTGRDVRDE